MLEYLDQLAFSALLLLSQIVGTPDIPKNPDPDWQIVQPWTELPDKTYEMRLLNEQWPKTCELDSNQAMIFDNIYMGIFEIYGDGRLIQTNSLDGKWTLSTVFTNVYLDCRHLLGVSKIEIRFISFIKYFSFLPDYPKLVTEVPKFYFFPKYLYALAASACLFMGIVGLTIIYRLLNFEDVVSFVLEDFLFMLPMLFVTSELLGGINVRISHVSVLFGLWGGIAFFFSFLLVDPKSNWRFVKYVLLLALIMLSAICFNYKNLTQLLIYTPVIPGLITLVYIICVDTGPRANTILDKFILSVILYFGFMTAYLAVVYRTGIATMALLVIFVSIFKFRKILREVAELIYQRQQARLQVDSESAIARTTYLQKEKYREILHDIRSPISSLNMVASLPSGSAGLMLNKIIDQLGFVLSKLEVELRSVDWYDIRVLISKLDVLIESYKIIFPSVVIEIKVKDIGVNESTVFCIDTEVISIFSELINNSLKHSKSIEKITIEVGVDKFSNFLIFAYRDDGMGVNDQDIVLLGVRGYSKSGSGTGLNSIKNKLDDWGGNIKFYPSKSGFYCEIFLSYRASRR